MYKSWSFSSSRNSNVGNVEGEKEAFQDLLQVIEEVDNFLHGTKDVPIWDDDALSKLLERVVDRYENVRNKFGDELEDDKSFTDVVDRISKLSAFCIDKTSSVVILVLEKAMSFLEKSLCALLEDSKTKTPYKSLSFDSHSDLSPNIPACHDEEDQEEEEKEDDFPPSFSSHKISILNKITTTMIICGYQAECCMTFSNLRRTAFKNLLLSFGYGTVAMEDIYRMQWESLEGEIVTWNKTVNHCTTVLFNAERRFYNSVFPNHPSISQDLFSNLARAVIIHFLNFAQGAVLTKRSAEKLFKFLDMYETLSVIGHSYPEQCAKELAHETTTANNRIAEVVVAMFCDLESSIKSDNQRIPVPNGAIHPLTRYVMNYLKYACEYKDTLEHLFEICVRVKVENNNKEEDGTPKKSPLALQLMTIMDLLDDNVERKSKLYRDPALQYIFLMNNGRYIVQKIKGCGELHEIMGDNWCRRRQSDLKLYHKCYQRETWSKVLQCLNPEGLHEIRNKVSKKLLKDRFKSFNGLFEEIHKWQSSWMVSDEQLQSELRVSVSALVIPAYRTFYGRFKHHLESSSGRHIDKYIKYHPEDIEILIDDLFVGNTTSMGRRKT